MTAKEFQRRVSHDESDFLDRFLEALRSANVAFCVIGGQAVNAYAEPLVSLDLDVVVVATRLSELESMLQARFQVRRFAHSLKVFGKGSDLRVQTQTDERYQAFLSRRGDCEVLGRTMPVASVGPSFRESCGLMRMSAAEPASLRRTWLILRACSRCDPISRLVCPKISDNGYRSLGV